MTSVAELSLPGLLWALRAQLGPQPVVVGASEPSTAFPHAFVATSKQTPSFRPNSAPAVAQGVSGLFGPLFGPRPSHALPSDEGAEDEKDLEAEEELIRFIRAGDFAQARPGGSLAALLARALAAPPSHRRINLVGRSSSWAESSSQWTHEGRVGVALSAGTVLAAVAFFSALAHPQASSTDSESSFSAVRPECRRRWPHLDPERLLTKLSALAPTPGGSALLPGLQASPVDFLAQNSILRTDSAQEETETSVQGQKSPGEGPAGDPAAQAWLEALGLSPFHPPQVESIPSEALHSAEFQFSLLGRYCLSLTIGVEGAEPMELKASGADGAWASETSVALRSAVAPLRSLSHFWAHSFEPSLLRLASALPGASPDPRAALPLPGRTLLAFARALGDWRLSFTSRALSFFHLALTACNSSALAVVTAFVAAVEASLAPELAVVAQILADLPPTSTTTQTADIPRLDRILRAVVSAVGGVLDRGLRAAVVGLSHSAPLPSALAASLGSFFFIRTMSPQLSSVLGWACEGRTSPAPGGLISASSDPTDQFSTYTNYLGFSLRREALSDVLAPLSAEILTAGTHTAWLRRLSPDTASYDTSMALPESLRSDPTAVAWWARFVTARPSLPTDVRLPTDLSRVGNLEWLFLRPLRDIIQHQTLRMDRALFAALEAPAGISKSLAILFDGIARDWTIALIESLPELSSGQLDVGKATALPLRPIATAWLSRAHQRIAAMPPTSLAQQALSHFGLGVRSAVVGVDLFDCLVVDVVAAPDGPLSVFFGSKTSHHLTEVIRLRLKLWRAKQSLGEVWKLSAQATGALASPSASKAFPAAINRRAPVTVSPFAQNKVLHLTRAMMNDFILSVQGYVDDYVFGQLRGDFEASLGLGVADAPRTVFSHAVALFDQLLHEQAQLAFFSTSTAVVGQLVSGVALLVERWRTELSALHREAILDNRRPVDQEMAEFTQGVWEDFKEIRGAMVRVLKTHLAFHEFESFLLLTTNLDRQLATAKA